MAHRTLQLTNYSLASVSALRSNFKFIISDIVCYVMLVIVLTYA
jgi:hypothetical protein